MKLSDAINNFTDHLAANSRSPLTIKVYRRDLKLLERFAGDVEVECLSPELLNRFVLSDAVRLTPTGATKAEVSVGRTKAALKSFGRFLADVGATSGNPARCLEIKRSPRNAPAFLTLAEQKRLLKALAARKGPAAERDLVILKLFLGAGLRLAELVNIDLADLNLDEKRVSVKVKGGRTETRFLNTELRTSLKKHLRHRREVFTDSPALFLSDREQRISARQVERRFGQWLAWAGIDHPGLSVHSTRHTFATNLYGRTRNIVLVSRALGHAQIGTTMVYTHLFGNEIEDALETL